MSTLVKLTQMVDLAVGTPEPGAVNLNILHSLLHVIVQQMHLEATQVEFRGDDAERMKAFINIASPYPTLRLSEYHLTSHGTHEVSDDEVKGGKEKPKTSKPASPEEVAGKSAPSQAERPSVVLVEAYEGGDKNTGHHAAGKYVTLCHGQAREHRQLYRKMHTPTSPPTLREIGDAVTTLKQDVSMMKEVKLMSNEQLIEHLRNSDEGGKPVGDMWELLKLGKRVDAAETGVGKLTCMIERLAKEVNVVMPEISQHAVSPDGQQHHKQHGDDDDVSKRVHLIEKRLWDVESRLGTTERRVSQSSTGGQAEADADAVIASEKEEATPGYTAGVLGGVNLEGLSPVDGMLTLRDELGRLRQEHEEQAERLKDAAALTAAVPLEQLIDGMRRVGDMRSKLEDVMGVLAQRDQLPSRLDQLEAQAASSDNQIANLGASMSPQIAEMQTQLANIERELGVVNERLVSGYGGGGGADGGGVIAGDGDAHDYGGFGELYGRLQGMQQDMDTVAQTTQRLMEEQDERELHMQALLEQVEVLKTVKADKEVLEDVLADKADTNVVNRKVSHDQFDAACEDLSRGLEEALTKLSQQETVWSTALDDIQREVETKLDKVEISPLKDFVNNKLRLLQERLKMLAALRKETEAAGTKHKLLRDVQCVSCDADVVQRRDDTGQGVASEALPPSRSMRPYLAYELDAVRRQQRRMPGVGRNMNHFQEAEKQQAARNRVRDDEGRDHLCNRYCGGSHTVTTPQQRVTRVGHFLTQWGPEVIPLQEKVCPTSPRLSTVVEQPQEVAPPSPPAPPSPTKSPTQRSPRISVTKPKKSSTTEEVVTKVVEATEEPKKATPPAASSAMKVTTPPKLSSPKAMDLPKESATSSPKGSPKTSHKGSPKTSPKGSKSALTSPKGSPKGSPKTSPKTTPKTTPKTSPKGSPKGSAVTTPKGSPPVTPSSPKEASQSIPQDADWAKRGSRTSQGERVSVSKSVSDAKGRSPRPSQQLVETVGDVAAPEEVEAITKTPEIVEVQEVDVVEEAVVVEEEAAAEEVEAVAEEPPTEE